MTGGLNIHHIEQGYFLDFFSTKYERVYVSAETGRGISRV